MEDINQVIIYMKLFFLIIKFQVKFNISEIRQYVCNSWKLASGRGTCEGRTEEKCPHYKDCICKVQYSAEYYLTCLIVQYNIVFLPQGFSSTSTFQKIKGQYGSQVRIVKNENLNFFVLYFLFCRNPSPVILQWKPATLGE